MNCGLFLWPSSDSEGELYSFLSRYRAETVELKTAESVKCDKDIKRLLYSESSDTTLIRVYDGFCEGLLRRDFEDCFGGVVYVGWGGKRKLPVGGCWQGKWRATRTQSSPKVPVVIARVSHAYYLQLIGTWLLSNRYKLCWLLIGFVTGFAIFFYLL